jgi:hypothetical protein
VPYSLSVNLQIPQEFVVPALPSCSSFSINAQSAIGVLTCYSVSTSNTIIIQNYSALSLVNGSRIALKVSLLNPNRTGTTGTFSILVYKANTTYVVNSYYNITGVVIQAGNIYSATFTEYNQYAVQSRNKVMDYSVSFTPKNPLSLDSVIVIDLPTGFTLVVGSGYDYLRVIQGV